MEEGKSGGHLYVLIFKVADDTVQFRRLRAQVEGTCLSGSLTYLDHSLAVGSWSSYLAFLYVVSIHCIGLLIGLKELIRVKHLESTLGCEMLTLMMYYLNCRHMF